MIDLDGSDHEPVSHASSSSVHGLGLRFTLGGCFAQCAIHAYFWGTDGRCRCARGSGLMFRWLMSNNQL